MKAPLETLDASKPFHMQLAPPRVDAATGTPIPAVMNENVLYRVVTEKHRDGRVRRVLRGRYMRELNRFAVWRDRQEMSKHAQKA